MKIRSETDLDHAEIQTLTKTAFAGAEHSSKTEGSIITRLRETQSLSLSLVIEIEDKIVAHAAFSPVLIDGKSFGWAGLGPVCVAPDWQRQGLGSSIIKAGLARLAAEGVKGCVVLGDPAYYQKFGFENDPDLLFTGAPAEYFMRLWFAGDIPAGHVTYQPVFYE